MNIKSSSSIVTTLILVYSVISLVSALGSNSGNVLSEVLFRVAPVLFIASLWQVKIGVSLLALTCCGVDFVKRLMILDVGISSIDIAKVLMIPLLIMMALIISGFIQALAHREKSIWNLFFAVIAVNIMIILKTLVAESIGMREIQQGVNEAIYLHLIWLIPHWIISLKWGLRDIINPFIFCGLCVCCYGLWQVKFGISDMDFDYIMSGHTMLIVEWRESWMRPFSTLSSVHGYSMTTVLIFGLLYYNHLNRKKFSDWFLILVAVAAVATCMVRTAWLAAALILLVFVITKLRFGFLLLVISGMSVFTAMLIFSEDIRNDLSSYQNQVESVAGTSDTKLGRMAQVSTYSERLQGFANLTNNDDMRTLFGYRGDKRGEDFQSHDPITSSFRDYGLVPVIGVLMVVLIGTRKLLNSIYRIKNHSRRRRCAFLFAVSVAVMASGLVSGGHLTVSPINVYWCIVVGILAVEFLRKNEDLITKHSI